MENPQSFGDACFVLRDNDPHVDGFFISTGSVDDLYASDVRVPGLAPLHELSFSRTFSNETTLKSLNILDAVGTYGWENMSSYLWTLGRFGNYGAEFVPDSITISTPVPEPTTLSLLALGALVVLRRSRSSRAA